MNGRALELTHIEYKLLCLLVRNADCVVTRERILAALWDDAGNFVDNNTLSVYIRRLREKVESDPSILYICLPCGDLAISGKRCRHEFPSG